MVKKFIFFILGIIMLISTANAVTYLNNCQEISTPGTYFINMSIIKDDDTLNHHICFPITHNGNYSIYSNHSIQIYDGFSVFSDHRDSTYNTHLKIYNLSFYGFSSSRPAMIIIRDKDINKRNYQFENITFNFSNVVPSLIHFSNNFHSNMSDAHFKNITGTYKIASISFGDSNVDIRILNSVFDNLTAILPNHVSNSYHNYIFAAEVGINYFDFEGDVFRDCVFIAKNFTNRYRGSSYSYVTRTYHNFYKIIDDNGDGIENDQGHSNFLICDNCGPDSLTFTLSRLNYSDKINNVYRVNNYEYGKNTIKPNYKVIDDYDYNLTTNEVILNKYNNISLNFYKDQIFIDNGKAIIMKDLNNLDNSFYWNNYWLEFTDNFNTHNINSRFKGMITVTKHNKINGVTFDKSGNNNLNAISNDDDTPVYDILINNSQFFKQDSRSNKINEYLINLYGNSITITNTTFMTGGISHSAYTLLNISADNPKSNKIYLNKFDSSMSDVEIGKIFDNDAGTLFYNNWVSAYYIISNKTNTKLNVTPYVGFYNPDDNKVYYYWVGNYYQGFSDNSTLCDDSDDDGFCDNSYLSGAVNDTHPLSEWPFNFKNHLLTADKSVDLNGFNITIYVPEAQNLIYNLESTSDQLEFAFAQNSSYPDLTCSYIINGEPKYSISNVNNDVQSIYLSGFNEGYYSFYVECFNDYVYERSELYSFFVNYPDGIDPPSNYTNSDGSDPDSDGVTVSETGSSVYNLGIISDNPTETADNIQGLFGMFNNLGGFGIVLGIGLLLIGLITFAFALLRRMIGGFW